MADAHSFDLIGVALEDDWLAPAFLSVVGVMRMAALIANGNWPVYGCALVALCSARRSGGRRACLSSFSRGRRLVSRSMRS
ncbi:MAG: hypothetical protein WBA37_05425 [Xanthobacteraceae bacterium]